MRAVRRGWCVFFFLSPVVACSLTCLSYSVDVSESAHANAETVQADMQAGGAGRQTHFSECVATVLSVHSFTVPVHCFLIIARPHSGSAPLLSPPGCPSVHLRDRLCGLAAADHSLMISKNNCGSISHTCTRGSKRFSKLLIPLLTIFFLTFLSLFFFSTFLCETIS